jgi:hypothetical protein
MKKLLCLAIVACAVCAWPVLAEDYTYTPLNPLTFRGLWDTPSNWTTSAGLRGISPPSLPNDFALIFGGGTATHYGGFFQIWPTGTYNLGQLNVVISNELYLGSDEETSRLIFTSATDKVKIALTNMVPDHQYYVNDGQLGFIFNTILLISNNLDIYITSVPYEYNGVWYTDSGGMFLDYDTILDGEHFANVYGGGFLTVGNYYTVPPTPQILISRPFTLHGTYLVLNEGAIVRPPLVLRSFTDCKNEFQRSTMYGLGAPPSSDATLLYNVDFVFSNAYYNAWNDWKTNLITPGGVYNRGSMTVHDWALLAPEPGCLLQFNCDVRGNDIWKSYTGTAGGDLEFIGSISPGIDGNGLMWIEVLGTSGVVRVGTKNDKVDLNIGINGLHNWIDEDHDSLAFDGVPTIGLGNIALKLNVGTSNPYRTNEIMYSADSGLAGSFSSISWIGGRTGEVIVTPDSVYVTGIPPATTNFFDVDPDSIILEQGQTQAWVTLRSPYSVNVTASNDEPWITVAPQVAVPANTPVQTSVNVPAGQPTTNGWGFSVGSVWYRAAADPTTAYEVPVFVVQPGYFELNTRALYFYENQADYLIVRAYAPFAVNASVAAINSPWITPDPTSIGMTDSYAYVDINVAAMPAGTTGTVRFANTGVPSVVHDLAVNVIANGFFDTVEKELMFVQGETQKWFEIFSPLRAEVDMQGSAPWVTVPPHISLDGDAWMVPVEIPASQPVDSTGQVALVNSCFSNITQTVTITVVPEAGVTALLAVIALGWVRRTRV